VTWAAGVHAAVVSVDVVTGVVRVLRFVVSHDCGRVVNPQIADGQVMGGVMQGIGGALYEEVVYDEWGQLLTANFMDYMLPTVGEMPEFVLAHVNTPSPLNPLGVKGLGEGGAIGPPAAVANAVEDALADLGVVVRATPLTPSRVRELVRAAQVNTVDSSV
jgi:carbon-monoxide dehydrogenase large subunit